MILRKTQLVHSAKIQFQLVQNAQIGRNPQNLEFFLYFGPIDFFQRILNTITQHNFLSKIVLCCMLLNGALIHITRLGNLGYLFCSPVLFRARLFEGHN